jgi:MarC family membrane protein
MEFILSTALLLFLVMDPLGNIPIFINELKHVPAEKQRRIIFREACIAFGVLSLFLLFGKNILALLQISQASLGIAGGVILFIISLKMIFSSGTPLPEGKEEPFIVPLAIPMIAGPSALATIILIQGKAEATILKSFSALLIAWLGATLILIFAQAIARILGKKTVDASESLMGLLLTAIAVEMLIKGIKNSFFPG